MIRHLNARPRRRPWLERIGLRRDLSERLILRGVPADGDLVDETAGRMAEHEAAEAWLSDPCGPVGSTPGEDRELPPR